MATATTFNSLLADLRKYLERGSVTDPEVFNQLPALINLAERNIARGLKVLGTQNVVISIPPTGGLVAGVSVYAKPDRWRDTISMCYGGGLSLNDRKFLFPRSLEYCRTYWPNSDGREEPEFYADYDYQHWLIVPTPVITRPWEIIYYQQPPLLDTVNQTNWLSDYAPDALLYRSLLECEPFLKNDERMGTWQNMFTSAMGLLDGEDMQRIIDRTTTRMKD
jgi:hypothetical protein